MDQLFSNKSLPFITSNILSIIYVYNQKGLIMLQLSSVIGQKKYDLLKNILNVEAIDTLEKNLDNLIYNFDSETYKVFQFLDKINQVSYDEIYELDDYHIQSKKIKVINSDKDMVSSIKDIKNYPVIGFDAEKKVSFEPFNNNGVAIVQISTDDTCYIFQIKYISDLEPLFELLEDRSVAKVGIGLHNDIKWFKKEFDVYLDATIELNNIFKIDTTNELGTKKITAIVLDKHIKKQKKIVKSNWELKNLTPSQIKYAAEDASVALDIFNQLLLKHQYTIHLMPKWFQFKHLKKEEYRPYKEEPFNQIMLELDKKTKNH